MLNIPEYKNAEAVFRFFEEVTRIPRGSGNTGPIAKYLVNFAKERGLYVRRDEFDNVIIKKPASKGREDRPGVIVQGHTDIVAEKLAELDKDMLREGVDIYRDGDFLRARGTTLGGDDGVALAYALAVLDSDEIEHPAFEALFTSDEETGLTGATGLNPFDIEGRLLINIDSDDEGVFTVGCAGGVRVDVNLPIVRECYGDRTYRISLSGLAGGHSGIEINRGRENAIKLLATLLSRLSGDFRLVSLTGGNADNAIPRDAEAVIATSGELSADDVKLIEGFAAEFAERESGMSATVEAIGCDTAALDEKSSRTLTEMVCALPTGVIGMSRDIEGLVETSLNMGIARLGDESFSLSFSVRSAKGAEKETLVARVRAIAEGVGATVGERGAYPAWEYKKDSYIRDLACDVFREVYGSDAEVLIIHAGLECGILSGKIEGLDAISLGPDNFDIHTTEEHLSIPSTARVWEYLKALLKRI